MATSLCLIPVFPKEKEMLIPPADFSWIETGVICSRRNMAASACWLLENLSPDIASLVRTFLPRKTYTGMVFLLKIKQDGHGLRFRHQLPPVTAFERVTLRALPTDQRRVRRRA